MCARVCPSPTPPLGKTDPLLDTMPHYCPPTDKTAPNIENFREGEGGGGGGPGGWFGLLTKLGEALLIVQF